LPLQNAKSPRGQCQESFRQRQHLWKVNYIDSELNSVGTRSLLLLLNPNGGTLQIVGESCGREDSQLQIGGWHRCFEISVSSSILNFVIH
jgi:hypothetical protein